MLILASQGVNMANGEGHGLVRSTKDLFRSPAVIEDEAEVSTDAARLWLDKFRGPDVDESSDS